jgi:ParE toxin of type II toxin-antitoxin system, parDE
VTPTSDTQLRGRLDGLRSLRGGTYRIIYPLADDDQTVRVAAIRHRSIPYGTAPADVRRVRNDASAAAIRSMNAVDAARRALASG